MVKTKAKHASNNQPKMATTTTTATATATATTTTAAATTATAAAAAPVPSDGIDMTFINELYEEIESRSPAIEARKLLIQQCIAANWDDAARDAVKQLLRLVPGDDEAKAWAISLSLDDFEEPKPADTKDAVATGSGSAGPSLPDDTEQAKAELLQGYERLKANAKRLHAEISVLRDVTKSRDESTADSKPIQQRLDAHIHNLSRLAEGRVSTVLRVQKLRSTRAVARDMEADEVQAVDIAVSDFEDLVQWLKSQSQPAPAEDGDAIREALVKRVRVLSAALPENLKAHATVAFMHVEHEVLKRTYVNDETMYGDPIPDIPRANFLVTDDGYAWDMEELAQAITSNGGVMRNPLSRQMFTTNDIRAIVQHPHGKQLGALQIEQSKLSQGVRPKTIEEMEKMATVLLADMSDDQMQSRLIVDAFMAYVATLPEGEQKALAGLRVPAKDSHTGQGYDTTIGEAVSDAQGNRVCFHKTGDFLRQAAAHLKKRS